MRVLAFSDLHLWHDKTEAVIAASETADLVIGCGDFCNHHNGLAETMARFGVIEPPVLIVPGNHETLDELNAAAPKNVTVLHGTGTIVAGLNVFGLGGGIPETPFDDWSWDISDADAGGLLARCQSADILMTHSPPKGIGDFTRGASVGSVAIYDAIERLQPKLALCGHIHEGWGQRGQIGITDVINLGPTVNWFEVSP